jgi:hypothetical protein
MSEYKWTLAACVIALACCMMGLAFTSAEVRELETERGALQETLDRYSTEVVPETQPCFHIEPYIVQHGGDSLLMAGSSPIARWVARKTWQYEYIDPKTLTWVTMVPGDRCIGLKE